MPQDILILKINHRYRKIRFKNRFKIKKWENVIRLFPSYFR